MIRGSTWRGDVCTELGDKIKAVCGENPSEETEVTTDGIVRLPELRRESQYA